MGVQIADGSSLTVRGRTMEAKIEKVEVFILRVPLGPDRFWSSQSAFPERNSLLVKVSSGKKCGWGEAGHYGPPEPVAAAIQHVLAPRYVPGLLAWQSSR